MRYLAALLVLLAACDSSPPPVAAPPIQTTAVSDPGQTHSLEAIARAALVCNSGSLTFSVVEGSVGGSVDSAGNYTAPSCGPSFVAATYHVQASGCGNTVQIPIAVTEAVTGLAIVCAIVPPATTCSDPGAGPVPVLPGQQVQLYAKLSLTCHSVFVPPIPAGACTAAFCQ